MKTNLDTADLVFILADLTASLFIARAYVPDLLPGSSCLLFGVLASAVFALALVCWRVLTRKRRREE